MKKPKQYSHSKISTFEQCPQKFKFRYIDKIKPKVEKSIEAHLGSCVHEALEWIYRSVKENKVPTLDEVVIFYSEKWKALFKPDFLIVKKEFSAQDYFNKGIEFLINYYVEHQPFDDNTIEVEKKIEIFLGENDEYIVRGFIDRLVYNLETGEYEIHDYKTANFLPTRETMEKDKQLALYSIAVKEIYGEDKDVKLVWHYLAHNKKIKIKKTSEQLEMLKKETLERIKFIEIAEDFPFKKSQLCHWCEFKDICPAWRDSETGGERFEVEEKIEDAKTKYPTASKYFRKSPQKTLNIWD